MIPFNNRFHGHSSLRYVYKNGKALRARLLTVKITQNKHRKNSRYAVVISKKVLKSAVKRNRVRRRVYECLRLQFPNIDGIYDIVLIISCGEIISIPHDELNNQIRQLLDQAGVIKTP
ncbi:ribonuclease P protein component [Candidatus Saccharibacteria bacterium HGW-Saccharibacteria-1]|jgi:ribonuclease P protein component|nr:MAG: ribonuclease P protein component [Candidatus Saccharibacteria bacterium HGW-Saccharibacteria-1]